jgi:hypothetical protein
VECLFLKIAILFEKVAELPYDGYAGLYVLTNFVFSANLPTE